MLQVSELTCARSGRLLFSELAFELESGQVLQVVGGNGKGKSTLLRILVGLYSDYEGNIDWLPDEPPLFLGHRIGVKGGLTVLENLSWQAALRQDLPREREPDQVLSQLALSDYGSVRAARLSEGQRKRLSLAPFLMLRHDCWMMDEPLSALDQEGQVMLLALMDEHVAAGGAVLFTSHQVVTLTSGVTTLELA